MVWTYNNITGLLFVAVLLYFRIAGHFNIIDKPNERRSHSASCFFGELIVTVSMIS